MLTCVRSGAAAASPRPDQSPVPGAGGGQPGGSWSQGPGGQGQGPGGGMQGQPPDAGVLNAPPCPPPSLARSRQPCRLAPSSSSCLCLEPVPARMVCWKKGGRERLTPREEGQQGGGLWLWGFSQGSRCRCRLPPPLSPFFSHHRSLSHAPCLSRALSPSSLPSP
eukprot:746334-Rhodomonas_salina.4